MRYKYVFSLGANAPDSAEKIIEAWLVGKGTEWWHWLPNLWLISSTELVEFDEVGKLMSSVLPNMRYIFLRVSNHGWHAQGPMNTEEDMFQWIWQFWSEKEPPDRAPRELPESTPVEQ